LSRAPRCERRYLERDGEELGVPLDVLLLAGDRRESEALVGVLDLGRVDEDVAVVAAAHEAGHGTGGLLGEPPSSSLP